MRVVLARACVRVRHVCTPSFGLLTCIFICLIVKCFSSSCPRAGQFHIYSANETELLSHHAAPSAAGGASGAAAHNAVTFFWITGDPFPNSTGSVLKDTKSGVDYAIWRFYLDGEATASVELQTSQAALVGNADPSGPWNNDFFGKNSLLGGWHFNLPIPFASSVRVTLQLPAWFPGGDDRIFAMVRGIENYPVTVAGFTLPPAARLVASVVNASLAPLEFHDLITVPAGKSGLMLGTMIDIAMYGKGYTSLNTLEGCWHAYSPPTTPYPGSFLLGTGAEDYPESVSETLQPRKPAPPSSLPPSNQLHIPYHCTLEVGSELSIPAIYADVNGIRTSSVWF